MTSSYQASSWKKRLGSKRGFTLAEVVVTLLVLSLISTAVFGSFLFFSRSGLKIGNYMEIDSEARTGLETFGFDVRSASAVNWTSSQQIQLTVPLNETTGSYTVTYAYFDKNYGVASLKETLSRQVTASSDTSLMPIDGSYQPVIKGVSSLLFRRYKITTPTDPAANSSSIPQATSDDETKQINIDLTAYRTGDSKTNSVATNSFIQGTSATNVILSGRYVLRNVIVAH